jgi:hypothetical protein
MFLNYWSGKIAHRNADGICGGMKTFSSSDVEMSSVRKFAAGVEKPLPQRLE